MEELSKLEIRRRLDEVETYERLPQPFKLMKASHNQPRIVFMSATPINTSVDDILKLYKPNKKTE